jgi:hypothetical protein
VKSIELDFIIAIELEYKKRLFAIEKRPLSQLLKHSLAGKHEDITQKVKKYIDAGRHFKKDY